MKKCRSCGNWKEFSAFIKNGLLRGRQLYRSRCKVCYTARKKEKAVPKKPKNNTERKVGRPRKLIHKPGDTVIFRPKSKYVPLDIPELHDGSKARIVKEGEDDWDWSIIIMNAKPTQKARLCMDDELEKR